MSDPFEQRVQPTADEETIRRQAQIARSITNMAHGLKGTPDPAGDMRFCGRCFEALAQMYEEERRGEGLEGAQRRTISFWYSGAVPSKANYRKGGADWRKKWGRIKDFEAEVGWLAKRAGAVLREDPVEIYILARGQRLDLDNICKATIDALCGVAIPADDQRYLVGVHVVRCHRDGEAGVEVSIRYTSHDVVREESA